MNLKSDELDLIGWCLPSDFNQCVSKCMQCTAFQWRAELCRLPGGVVHVDHQGGENNWMEDTERTQMLP